MTYEEINDLIDGNLANLSDIHPSEHRQVEKAILDYAKDGFDSITTNLPNQLEVLADIVIQLSDHNDEYPTGYGINLGSVARLNSMVNDSRYQINYSNPLSGNYFVVLSVESKGTLSDSWNNDNDIIVSYKEPTINGIQILLKETGSAVQDINIHLTIIKY